MSKPFCPDMTSIFSPAKKLQNDIKLLERSLPSEREMIFLQQTVSEQDLANFTAYQQSIRQRISELKQQYHEQFAAQLKSTGAEAKQRSFQVLQQKQDQQLLQWIEHEDRALDRIKFLEEEKSMNAAQRQLRKEALVRSAKETHEELLQQRADKIQQKIGSWKERVSQIDTEKETEQVQRQLNSVSRSQDHRHALADKDVSLLQEERAASTSGAQAIITKLQNSSRRRELFSQQRSRSLQNFLSRYPTHCEEVHEWKSSFFASKMQQSEEQISKSRERRSKIIQGRAQTLSKKIGERMSESRQRYGDICETAHQRNFEKANKIAERLQELRDEDALRSQSIVRRRIAHDVELSFRSDEEICNSRVDSRATSRPASVADRLISRVLKVAHAQGISVAVSDKPIEVTPSNDD